MSRNGLLGQWSNPPTLALPCITTTWIRDSKTISSKIIKTLNKWSDKANRSLARYLNSRIRISLLKKRRLPPMKPCKANKICKIHCRLVKTHSRSMILWLFKHKYSMKKTEERSCKSSSRNITSMLLQKPQNLLWPHFWTSHIAHLPWFSRRNKHKCPRELSSKNLQQFAKVVPANRLWKSWKRRCSTKKNNLSLYLRQKTKKSFVTKKCWFSKNSAWLNKNRWKKTQMWFKSLNCKN